MFDREGMAVIFRVPTAVALAAVLTGACADADGQQVTNAIPGVVESTLPEPAPPALDLAPVMARAGLHLPLPADWFGSTPPQAEPQSTPAAQPPPEPEHTGFVALIRATGSDFAAFPKRQSTWVILGIGGG